MAVNILHNIERNVDPSEQTQMCKVKPTLLIERYCSILHMNQELIRLAKFVAKKIEEKKIIYNNTPLSITAGIVYFISETCNVGLEKSKIAQVCKISEVTIGKCYKKLESIKTDLIPSVILEKYA
jgi:transcription initiation factor TFIIIB Brf1 subunit/transcription initiation factor TFIIB